MRSDYFLNAGFPLGCDENALKLDSGDGCRHYEDTKKPLDCML